MAITTTTANNSKCLVNFDFDGLQILAFGHARQVTDGILDVVHHTPQIQIKKTQAGKTETLTTVNAEELKTKVLNISLPNRELNPSRYYSSDMTRDINDFRWCLDMESDLFQKQLYLNESKLFCKIRFNVGQFYTTHLTDDAYQFYAGEIQNSFNRRIGEPGAKIELHQQEKLDISGLDSLISLPYESGASYQVSVTNLPPKDMMSMDHFSYYYEIFKDQDLKRFMPVIVKKAAYGPHPFICSPVGLSKSRID